MYMEYMYKRNYLKFTSFLFLATPSVRILFYLQTRDLTNPFFSIYGKTVSICADNYNYSVGIKKQDGGQISLRVLCTTFG